MLPVQAEPVMDRLIVAAADGWAFGNARRNADGDGAVAWWGEHSLDMQRFYAVVCLMYGSDPARFEALADKVELPVERRQSCPNDYAQAASSWARLLEPHLVPDDRRGESKIAVGYGDPGAEFSHLADLVRSSGLVEAIAHDIGTSFALPRELSLSFDRCGQANAVYDPEKPGVPVCYELVDYFDKLIRDEIGRR
jgi:hypothetical protein